MAAPFKLALVGKFSFGRPPIDVIRKFFVALGLKGNVDISLLDPRHILIQLHLEEDYTRIWLRQSWFIDGRAMRVFKWSTTFHSSEESPIVPVWVSLPFLPVHYMRCKEALYSIAAVIGKPLRIDHATAAVSRPTVARVLIEYDISRPLLKRLWIGEKDTGFWQYIIFEKVPRYCATCKHVGHSDDTCYINKPELRKTDRVGSVRPTVVPDGESNKLKAPVKTQYVQKADNRNQNAATTEAATVDPLVVSTVPTTSADTSEAPHEVPTAAVTPVIISDPPVVAALPPPSIDAQPSVVCATPEPTCSDLVPATTSAASTVTTPTPLADLLPLSDDHAARVGITAGDLIYRELPAWDPYRHQGRLYRSSSWQTASSCDTFPDIPSTEVLPLPYAPYDAAPICTLNTESTDVPEVSPAPNTSKDRIGTSYRFEDYTDTGSGSSDGICEDVCIGISDSELMEGKFIERLGGQRIITSTEGFTEVTPRKGFKRNRRRRQY
ncbi:hypothetical protein AB3S75_016131 [Citrus x aurantiifolia]